MGRILLIAVAAVVGFFILGAVLGFLFNVLKWVLILGLIAVAVAGVLKLTRSGESRSHNPY
ncbi:hypothetical protein AB0K60_07440 [Thermopolyspora sp. NPDC052614]|uniref:hypothetical protein n=1 Tax=Thermopolyspora sp. NPDC052614 TaxID=3155682 RepID=UPI003447293D